MKSLRLGIFVFVQICFVLPNLGQILVPILGVNGKYGFATEEGKVVISPKFEKAVSLFKKDDLAIINNHGVSQTFILRNGIELQNCQQVTKAELELQNGVTKRLDNVALSISNGRKSIELIHLSTNKRKKYMHPKDVKQARWFKVNNKYTYPSEHQYQSSCIFYDGAHRVFKDSEQVNFIDTSLNEIFTQDYPAGTMVGHEYFILADNNRKLGIGHISGSIRSPFVWDQIEMAKKPGFFIVNQEENSLNKVLKPRVGLIDSDGHIVIDTVHEIIISLSDKYLGVWDNNKSGVMDYTGKWIIPQEYEGVSYFNGYFIVQYKAGVQNVIDIFGKKQFPIDFEKIIDVGLNYTKRIFLECISSNNRNSLVDDKLQIMYQDTLTQINSRIRLQDTTIYHFNVNDGGHKYYNNDRIGVRDIRGKIIVPGMFNQINVHKMANEDVYLVRKDSLYGVYNINGDRILPVEFNSIFSYTDDKILWARRETEKMFLPYDISGSIMPIPPIAFSDKYGNSTISRELKSDKTAEIVMLDGNRIPMKDVSHYLKWSDSRRINKNGFFFNDKVDSVQIVNAFFKPIIPYGFTIPKKHFYELELKTGLVPVYKLSSSGLIDSCGVVNANGDWVLTPKVGVHYYPMSSNLIAERKANQVQNRNQSHLENIKIIRINDSKIQETFTVNIIASRIFTPNINNTMLMCGNGLDGPCAYYHASGEKLTDDIIMNGGLHLERKNIVTIRDSDGSSVDAIIDGRGKLIAKLPGMEADKNYERSREHWEVSYFTAQDKKTGLLGLVDSLGQIVLPLQFKDLEILSNNRLLSCTNSFGKTDLINWHGNVIYSAETKVNKHFLRLHDSPNDFLFVEFENLSETVVINNDNQLVRSIPATSPHIAKTNEKEVSHLVSFYFKGQNKRIWVNIINGKIFKE